MLSLASLHPILTKLGSFDVFSHKTNECGREKLWFAKLIIKVDLGNSFLEGVKWNSLLPDWRNYHLEWNFPKKFRVQFSYRKQTYDGVRIRGISKRHTRRMLGYVARKFARVPNVCTRGLPRLERSFARCGTTLARRSLLCSREHDVHVCQ